MIDIATKFYNKVDVGYQGESRFLEAADQHLDLTHVIYHNRNIVSKEFDTCILVPGQGMALVEIKGWSNPKSFHVTSDGYVELEMDGQMLRTNPLKQARGYSYSMDRMIRSRFDLSVPIAPMVCYPFLTKCQFQEAHLSIISDEEDTFLQEDLEDRDAFLKKIGRALQRQALSWRKAAFDPRVMMQVRSIFEPNPIPFVEEATATLPDASHSFADYSYVAYITDEHPNADIEGILARYSHGCRIMVGFSSEAAWNDFVRSWAEFIKQLGICFDKRGHVAYGTYELDPQCKEISVFNMKAAFKPLDGQSSFFIRNGMIEGDQRASLKRLSGDGFINLEQFLIEHADPEMNILVRAGAGTGKTHTMIQRILYLCYARDIRHNDIQNRIHMITFTREAAESMKRKLKSSLVDYFRLTGNPAFESMLEMVEHMKIGTIHSYALEIIKKYGANQGYGPQLQIGSSTRSRRDILIRMLEEYIDERKREDPEILGKLEMPFYELRKKLLAIIERLDNKNVVIPSLDETNFGVACGYAKDGSLVHDLIANVINRTENAFVDELIRNNRIHLGKLMTVLKEVLMHSRESELRNSEASRFLFVDEFQDTDNVQIEAIQQISREMGFRLFVVGDIKQCIYRFRGADEQSFDKLDRTKNWLEFGLSTNYRSDCRLLERYHATFSALGARDYLRYTEADRIFSLKSLNDGKAVTEFYRCMEVESDDHRMDALFARLRESIEEMEVFIRENPGSSVDERTIAILVRENWQANRIADEARNRQLPAIQTETGGDLFRSTPAIEMGALLQALQHKRIENLYHLLTTNFFRHHVDKIEMCDRNSPSLKMAYLIDAMDQQLKASSTSHGYDSWDGIQADIRRKPILQIINTLYTQLQPWEQYSNGQTWLRDFYRLNVGLLIEKALLVNRLDNLSLDPFSDFIRISIASNRKEECRWPDLGDSGYKVKAVTVHKAKGLEYGHVLLPYADMDTERVKYNSVNLMLDAAGDVGYQFTAGKYQNSRYDKDKEATERIHEESRLLYVAMTRAIRGFSYISSLDAQGETWQSWIE